MSQVSDALLFTPVSSCLTSFFPPVEGFAGGIKEEKIQTVRKGKGMRDLPSLDHTKTLPLETLPLRINFSINMLLLFSHSVVSDSL